MKHIKHVLMNPFFIILPIVGMLLLGWQHYADAEEPSINSASSNILPNGGFDELDGSGHVAGWELSPWAESVHIIKQAGYNSPKSLLIRNTSDQNGTITLTSPAATVRSGTPYLFKGYYQASMPFDLIVRRTYKDGSSRDRLVRHYESSKSWTTVADAFIGEPSIQTVQFIYSFAGVGSLQLDNSYLEPDPDDVYIAPQPQLVNNLIPNPPLASSDGKTPDKWSSFTVGNNHANFSRMTDNLPTYLRAQVADYKDGEAKWQYEPVAVQPGQYFQFGVSYLADRPADVVAEYVLSSGQRKFATLDTLLPANDWTEYTKRFVAPAGATNVVVSLILRGNGTLSSKDYSLYNISKSGELNWQEPLVSLTFDDGWESDYTSGAPLLDRYGYKGTFYLNPSSLHTEGFMNSRHVRELNDKGHELASHGYEHLDFRAQSKQAIDYQLGHASDYFSDAFSKSRVNFATPFGGTDPQVEHYARKYYASHRGTESGINTRQNVDPYNLMIFYVGNDTPLAKLSEVINEAKASNGWLILVYHRISTEGHDETTINPTAFQLQLSMVKQSGVKVKTVAAALREVMHE